jgi:hypothetical protein
MTKDDTAVFHAFAWNPVKAEYDDWRGMGTPAAIAARSLEAQGPVHYCPKEWLRAANRFSAVATVTRDNLVRWSCHRHFRAGDKRNVTGDGQSRGEEHENLFHGRLLAFR